MNHFDAVDFSKCHSEEVMFLLTLSVFLQINKTHQNHDDFDHNFISTFYILNS